ncbi:PDZ domain-containing protein [Cohnella soli]|uniref:PDZ domain-containing protein n=1 Tax=Cohnella soli TaxID=425005 RepID=A0ABW0I402_9BACL
MIDCPKDRSVNVTYIEAPIETVWKTVATTLGSNAYLTDQALTSGDPEQPKIGDRFTLYYGDIINRAVVLHYEPYKLFVLSDAYESMAPDGTVDPFPVRTSYAFESYGQAFTKLTLEVQGYDSDTYGQWFRECLEMGWRRSLLNLKSVLELGMDLRNELFSYPRLGITNCTVNAEQCEETGVPEGRGNYLLTVFPNGPAERGGLAQGDVITAIDGKPVPDYRTYVRVVSGYYASKVPVTITYVRNGQEGEVVLDLTIDRMFTGLIEGTDAGQEEERKRRQRMASERSASGAIWKNLAGKDESQ